MPSAAVKLPSLPQPSQRHVQKLLADLAVERLGLAEEIGDRQGRRFLHDASVGLIQGTKLLYGPTRPKPFAFLALGPCQSFLNSGFSTSLSSSARSSMSP